MKILLTLLALLLLSGCSQEKKIVSGEGKKLLESKCASCHNLSMPPELSESELAPPMMAVSFHVYQFTQASQESLRRAKAIEFVVDYVQNPSYEKSFCDKESLKRYGIMPSQKGSVTPEEIRVIAAYMFDHFTPQSLAQIQKERALYDALSDGEKLARKENCLSCHRRDIELVGPSFKSIVKRYRDSQKSVEDSIKNGSSKKWKKQGALMPAFKHLTDAQILTLTKWIFELEK